MEKLLKKLEDEYSMTVLFAVENGSRAFGLDDADSDYDVRFIFKYPKNEYLKLTRYKDTIEYSEDDYDVAGWELKKALGLFHKANPHMMEYLVSPIVYKENEMLRKALTELVPKTTYGKSKLVHYYGLCQGQYGKFIKGQEVVRLKKLFYALRAAMYLHIHFMFPSADELPQNFIELVMSFSALEPKLSKRFLEYVDMKKAGVKELPLNKEDEDFIVSTMQKVYGNMGRHYPDEDLMEKLDKLCLKMLK